MINCARDSTSSSGFEKEQTTGADGACGMTRCVRRDEGGGRRCGVGEYVLAVYELCASLRLVAKGQDQSKETNALARPNSSPGDKYYSEIRAISSAK